MNLISYLMALANGETCVDVVSCYSSMSDYDCTNGKYYNSGTEYDEEFLHVVCPVTCAKNHPEKSCLQWKYYPDEPPSDNTSSDCVEFVSQKTGVMNSECAKICKETDECIHQPMDRSGCYGNWMYGYDDEFDFIDDKAITDWTFEKRFENHFYYVKELWEGSTPADCQEECQKEEECGFFAWRHTQADQKNTLVNDHSVPICLMKTRDTVVLANNELVPLSLYETVASTDIRWDWCNMNLTYECNTPDHYECKNCEGTPVCAWKSYYHTSGPKYCGTDAWMEKHDSCDIELDFEKPTEGPTEPPASPSKEPEKPTDDQTETPASPSKEPEFPATEELDENGKHPEVTDSENSELKPENPCPSGNCGGCSSGCGGGCAGGCGGGCSGGCGGGLNEAGVQLSLKQLPKYFNMVLENEED